MKLTKRNYDEGNITAITPLLEAEMVENSERMRFSPTTAVGVFVVVDENVYKYIPKFDDSEFL